MNRRISIFFSHVVTEAMCVDLARTAFFFGVFFSCFFCFFKKTGKENTKKMALETGVFGRSQGERFPSGIYLLGEHYSAMVFVRDKLFNIFGPIRRSSFRYV